MNRQEDKRRRAQRRFKQRAMALGVVAFTVAAVSFLYFGTDLFSSEENATYTFTLLEPAKDSVSSGFADRVRGGKKRSHTPKKTAAVNPLSPDTAKTVISAKDNKVLPLQQREETKKLSSAGRAEKKSRKTAYEVKSVAHFYSRPSEKTRRKEVIKYWNQSYASIKPINEKNGFVFVEFKYPSGQRSEGWLRKKDLKKVNAAYQNNKE